MRLMLILILSSIGGIFGGMGMGGGTVLIPILTIILKTEQKLAQAYNLISFVPMAIVAIIIHARNKLIKTKGILYIIFPAIISTVGGCFVAKYLPSGVLRRIFGAFLILLSIIQAYGAIKKKKQKH